jgi:signal transduction histidine kinase
LHGQHLIQSLLSLRYLESGEQRPEISQANADEFIRRVVEAYQAKAMEKKIELTLHNDQPLGTLSTDYSHLERILDNLVSNALKFSKSGTHVQVRTGRTQNSWWLSVSDKGPGIKPEERDRLFSKFKRLSARPTGGESSTGLGLAIVKLLVESLKGTISVETEVGQGTTFKVEFPL